MYLGTLCTKLSDCCCCLVMCPIFLIRVSFWSSRGQVMLGFWCLVIGVSLYVGSNGWRLGFSPGGPCTGCQGSEWGNFHCCWLQVCGNFWGFSCFVYFLFQQKHNTFTKYYLVYIRNIKILCLDHHSSDGSLCHKYSTHSANKYM